MSQNKETFQGTVNTLKDAVLLIEGVRLGMLPSVTKRLNEYERELIKPNLIYVWNETECGLKRWTDGKIWSASKALGPFLIYTELEKKADTKPKHNGLVKQSFSLNTKQNQRFHLIAYLSSDELENLQAPQIPSTVSSLSHLYLSPNIYQENILSYVYNGSTTPMQHQNLLTLLSLANSFGQPQILTQPPQTLSQSPQTIHQPIQTQQHPQPLIQQPLIQQTLIQQPHPQQPRPPQPHPQQSHPQQPHPQHPHPQQPQQQQPQPQLHPQPQPQSHPQSHPQPHPTVGHQSHVVGHIHLQSGHQGHPQSQPHHNQAQSQNAQLIQLPHQLSHTHLHTHQQTMPVSKPTLHDVIDTPPRRRYNEDDQKILLTLNRNFDKPK